MGVAVSAIRATAIAGVAAAVAAAVALSACAAAPGRAPVINKAPHRVIPPATTVAAGDSLYAIAWRFGLDFQDIAEWNGLRAPFALRPGQRLRLRAGKSAAPVRAAATATVATVAPAKIAKPGAPAAAPAAAAAAKSPQPAAAPGKWRWPAEGQLVGKFSRTKGQNGIQIAGAPGSPIRATAGGDVVYAGEGLRGYGKLVIVKHSPAFLSAYAHNRRLMVAEGARVNAGQQIAQMGESGAARVMLHFEIRKHGKPVDPLKFLD